MLRRGEHEPAEVYWSRARTVAGCVWAWESASDVVEASKCRAASEVLGVRYADDVEEAVRRACTPPAARAAAGAVSDAGAGSGAAR